jgi:hypothetical protein
MSYAGRLHVSNRMSHLEPTRPLEMGDTVEVVRGNGPREGDVMGIATVTGFFEDGRPRLHVDLGEWGSFDLEEW